MKSRFHWDLWILLTVENWVLDFGRPIAMILFDSEYFPLNRPSIGDYFHMVYNIVTAFIILELFQRSGSRISHRLVYLIVLTFVMGASIHLVGDSVNHRLALLGFQHHISVEDNPIFKDLNPKGLIKSFELLYYYDEYFGHLMWYIPIFASYYLYFTTCFAKRASSTKGFLYWNLVVSSGIYHWYLGTEGQITPLILVFYMAMVIELFRKGSNKHLTQNGLFLFHTFSVSLFLTILWVLCLWKDPILRKKYPGLFYVPEPWSVYSMLYGI